MPRARASCQLLHCIAVWCLPFRELSCYIRHVISARTHSQLPHCLYLMLLALVPFVRYGDHHGRLATTDRFLGRTGGAATNRAEPGRASRRSATRGRRPRAVSAALVPGTIPGCASAPFSLPYLPHAEQWSVYVVATPLPLDSPAQRRRGVSHECRVRPAYPLGPTNRVSALPSLQRVDL